MVRPEVLANNKTGTPNVGISGIDARWRNFGSYLQKFIDTVQIHWDGLNEQSEALPPSGTKVAVKFRIDSEGKIAEIIDVESNGGTQATRICVSAITDRAPYGKWTDNMKAMLGDSQEMTFTFYYGKPANAKAASTAKIYDLGELDQKPEVRGTRAMPVFPMRSGSGIADQATLEFIVDTNGDVRDIKVVASTNKEFEQPAKEAVSKWKFSPGKKGGRAVNTRMRIPISFGLNDDDN